MSELLDASNKSRQRVSWTPEDRAQWLELFRGSGQSAAEFCRQNDLSPATLSFWLRQESRDEEGPQPDGGFVQIALSGMPTPTAMPVVTVHLPSGARLEVSAAADAAWVGQLLRAMQPAGEMRCSA